MKPEFESHFGFNFDEMFGSQMRHLEELELVVQDRECVKLTELGTIYVDDVCRSFYSKNTVNKLINDEIGNAHSDLELSLV